MKGSWFIVWLIDW